MKIDTSSITIGEQDIKLAKYLAVKEYNKTIQERIMESLLDFYNIERFSTSSISSSGVTRTGKDHNELCEELVKSIC